MGGSENINQKILNTVGVLNQHWLSRFLGLFWKKLRTPKYIQKQSSLNYINARKSAGFQGKMLQYEWNNKIFFQPKEEKVLAPHRDDAALSVWFLQTTTVTLSGCLSDPLSTVCLTLWYFQQNSVGKQMSSRNENHYKFSVDCGKEDWSTCHFEGKGCCVTVVSEQDS